MDADGDDEGCRILNEVLQKNGDNVAKFIGDHHCKTLLVERALVGKDDDEEGEEGVEVHVKCEAPLDVRRGAERRRPRS